MSDSGSDDLQTRIEEAVKNPRNLGEMKDADAIGTVGSADCGDMLRMWVKFKEEGGRKVIDRATFQTFGCQTAIAVASVATEMLAGKTIAEAKSMSGQELAAPLGALPPVKIHCAQLVEGALRSALSGEDAPSKPEEKIANAPTLLSQLNAAQSPGRKVKIVVHPDSAQS
jgi:nitrogen fixation NifU-like protein